MARRRSNNRRKKKKERNSSEEAPRPSFLNYVSGDIFGETHKFKAIAVDAHPEGVINTDFGLKLRLKYPEVIEEYVRCCQAEPVEFVVGQSLMLKARDGMTVFVLGTQENKYMTMASDERIAEAFQQMRQQMDAEEITTLAMPPVGAGLGALRWHVARRSLERAFKDWEGEISVYMKSS